MDFLIERYRPEDFDTLSVLIGRLQEATREHRPELKPASVVADLYTQRAVETAEVILIGRLGEDAVGCVIGSSAEDDDPCLPEDQRVHGLISDLYVEEGSRRRGLGAELLRQCEEELLALGYRHLRLAAHPTNSVAVSFFSDRGYLPSYITFRKQIN